MLHWGWFAIALFSAFGAGLFLTCLMASAHMTELRSEAAYWKMRAQRAEHEAATWRWRREDESKRV